MARDVTKPCRVSVIIACLNAERYVDEAILSARRQSMADIEILVVDDRSTDGTKARVQAHTEADPRVMMLDGPGLGPGAARNVAMRQAEGEWLAILDSDDFMHPRRLEYLLAAAERQSLDMVADNLFVFYDPPGSGPATIHLDRTKWTNHGPIDLATYLNNNRLFKTLQPLGYLKPLIRRQWLVEAGIAYDESLRIAEDFDLTARFLAGGGTFGCVPQPWYFYRRHHQSTSYRMLPEDAASIIDAAVRFHATLPAAAVAQRAASRQRQLWLRRALDFTTARGQIKQGDWAAAVRTIVTHPYAIVLTAGAVRDTVKRRLRERSVDVAAPGRVTSINRRALLLWTGGQETAAKLMRSLRNEGTAAALIMVPRPPRSVGDCPAGLLSRIAGQTPVDHIFCDHDALVELAPYALSPMAEITICDGADAVQTVAHKWTTTLKGEPDEQVA